MTVMVHGTMVMQSTAASARAHTNTLSVLRMRAAGTAPAGCEGAGEPPEARAAPHPAGWHPPQVGMQLEEAKCRRCDV